MNDLELTILRRLYGWGKIGASHTHVESVARGLPKHLKGDAVKAVKRLIKEGWKFIGVLPNGKVVAEKDVLCSF